MPLLSGLVLGLRLPRPRSRLFIRAGDASVYIQVLSRWTQALELYIVITCDSKFDQGYVTHEVEESKIANRTRRSSPMIFELPIIDPPEREPTLLSQILEAVLLNFSHGRPMSVERGQGRGLDGKESARRILFSEKSTESPYLRKSSKTSE